jgi:glycosyltransferase involved in cell wall biosynthesis
MKVCIVHNAYGKLSGEEVAVEGLREALTSHGHSVIPFFRSSAELEDRRLGKVGAFFTGIYNAAARREFAQLLERDHPDLVHINNLFPLISPSILDETKQRNIPTVMTLHNFRLLCPTGLMFSHGEVCHRCLGGREWWCAVRNCTGEWPKSAGYAARSMTARLRGSFVNRIDRFVAPSEFVKKMLSEQGYPSGRIDVVRYTVNLGSCKPSAESGEYAGYVGRISPEKGVDTIVEAARDCPDIKFRFAGHYQRMPDLPRRAPMNCVFDGQISAEKVVEFVSKARVAVFSSRWYEVSPLSLFDAMLQGKPVVSSRIGGLPEFVDDGVTGLLFTPGDSHDLAKKVRYLWERPELCRSMGEAARKKILTMFSPPANYERLIGSYQAASNRASSASRNLGPCYIETP